VGRVARFALRTPDFLGYIVIYKIKRIEPEENSL